MRSLVYDAGALLAAERRDPRLLMIHDEALEGGVAPIVPVVVLAQAWRGGPQAALSRLLKGCLIVPDSESVGRRAGGACAAARTSDVVDAIVVVTAMAHDAVVVTSDKGDLARLAHALDVPLQVHLV